LPMKVIVAEEELLKCDIYLTLYSIDRFDSMTNAGSLYIWKSLLPSILAQYDTVCFEGFEISITLDTDCPRLHVN
jgi:hypothetical protein